MRASRTNISGSSPSPFAYIHTHSLSLCHVLSHLTPSSFLLPHLSSSSQPSVTEITHRSPSSVNHVANAATEPSHQSGRLGFRMCGLGRREGGCPVEGGMLACFAAGLAVCLPGDTQRSTGGREKKVSTAGMDRLWSLSDPWPRSLQGLDGKGKTDFYLRSWENPQSPV